MKSSAGQLRERIETGTSDACVSFFSSMSPKERRSWAKEAVKAYKEVDQAWIEGVCFGHESKGISIQQMLENSRVCVFATATRSELRKIGPRVMPQGDNLVRLIPVLKLDWIDAWVEDTIKSNPYAFYDIRHLYEAGLCEKPSAEGYIFGMITVLPGWRQAPEWSVYKGKCLAEIIHETPDIRDHDIWRLFEVEGGGDFSLASFDKYIGNKKFRDEGKLAGWAKTLCELGKDGTLSRDRLLDASLEALSRDFSQFRAGWFSRFHEQLSPTLEERITRCDRYARLLHSGIAPTVSFALKALSLLDKAGKLPPEVLLDHIPPVMTARAKGTVKTGLQLIGNAVNRNPVQAGRAALIITQALIHEASDVQNKALDMIASLNGEEDPAVVTAIQEYGETIAPSVRAQFSRLFGKLEFFEQELCSTNCAEAAQVVGVENIGSFNELVQSILHVIEAPDDPLEIERVLNGLALHGNEKPLDFDKIIGPLKKRSASIIKRRPDDELQYQVALLAQAYCTGNDIDAGKSIGGGESPLAKWPESTDRNRYAFELVFQRRNIELLQQLEQGYQLPLLCAPTDNRGFVAVEILLARLKAYAEVKIQPGKIDVSLALMRLAPEHREANLSSSKKQKSELEDAIQYALGQETNIGPTDWLWVAAAAARTPYEEQQKIAQKHGRGNPDAGTKARYQILFDKDTYVSLDIGVEPKINEPLPILFLPSFFHVMTAGSSGDMSICGYHANMIRWSSSVWPLNPEAFFSQGLLYFDATHRLANSPYVAFLEPLLKADSVIGEMGSGLMLLGIASIDPAVKGIALDSMIEAIEHDRLNDNVIGDMFARLLYEMDLPVARWSQSLSELGVISSKHAAFVRELICASLQHDPADAPRQIGGLIELLYEICVATSTPVSDEDALQYLNAIGGGGKAGKFARKIVSLQVIP